MFAERAVADSLATRTDSERVSTLHNRRMPSGRGDIDHLAIAPTGVWVIDTKDWKGKVEISAPGSGSLGCSSAAATAPSSSTGLSDRSQLSAPPSTTAATRR
jgi:Nuclease-related domain